MPTEFILKFAIVPAVFAVIVFAEISPVTVALVAVKAPALVTLNGAEPNVLFPKCIPSSVLKETLVPPLPAIKDVLPILKPPIVPSWAVILPVIWAFDAVICPPRPFIESVPAGTPSTSGNNGVSSPKAILNPPNLPEVAVILPDILTSPEDDKWKLEDEISILPSDPDINWVAEPMKKLDELMYNKLSAELNFKWAPFALPTWNLTASSWFWKNNPELVSESFTPVLYVAPSVAKSKRFWPDELRTACIWRPPPPGKRSGSTCWPMPKRTPVTLAACFVITPNPDPLDPLIEFKKKAGVELPISGDNNIELVTSPSGAGKWLALIFVEDIVLAPIVNPDMLPALAVISPDPDKTRFLFVLDIASLVILNPPIAPAVAVIFPDICALDAVIWPVSPRNIKLLLDDDIAVDVIANPPIWPNVAVMPPCRYTLSVAKPNPGSVFPNTNGDPANPDKSPSLAFNDTSKIADPVLATISIYGVAWLLGFAFNLINPVPTLPVDTNTWDPE